MKKKNISFIAAALSLAGSLQSQERPNILWLTFEDTSPQFIGCYGNEAAHTPIIDSIATHGGGVRFNQAYSNSTVSSPSRSCIITGRDVNALGTGHHRYQRTVPDNIKGFPYYLRQAGYYTSNNEKTDYNIANTSFIPECWNESSAKAHWRKRPSASTPFFSVFNIPFSHQSYTTRNDFPYYETNVYNVMDESRKTDQDKMIVPGFYKNDAEMRSLMTRMQNCINYTDQVIESRIKELQADGLDENTIIFIFADHGQGIPRGKTTAIGMGYRVPFVVWFPEKWKHLNPYATQVVTDKQICFEDLAPTVLNLAGVTTPPSGCNGKAFLGTESAGQTYIHGSRNRIGESPGFERSVIKGRYVYTRAFSPCVPPVKNQGYDYNCDILCYMRRQNHQGQLSAVQQSVFQPGESEYLYDLESDPWETRNLASDAGYADLMLELRSEMVRYAKEIKDLGFMPEYEMQRRLAGTTPYQLRENYAIDAIVDAALLVGGGDRVLSRQLDLLGHSDELVRYWAVVGIYHQGDQAVACKDELLQKFGSESSDGVRIELAAFLYKYCGYAAAGDVLREYARGKDELLANDAVIKIQYFGEKTIEFKELIDEIQPYWAENDANYCVSPGVNTTQIMIKNTLSSPYSEVIGEGRFHIKNAQTKGYLAVKNGALEAKATVVQTTDRRVSQAQWSLEKKSDEHYALINQNSGMALSMNPASVGNGAIPYQAHYQADNGQLWLLRPYQYGFNMQNKATGKMLQVNGQSDKEGATVSQWLWNGKLHFNWALEKIENGSDLNEVRVSPGAVKIVSLVSDAGVLSVTYDLFEAGFVELKLIDLSGKILLTAKEGVRIPDQHNTLTVPLSGSIVPGCYIVELSCRTSKARACDVRKLMLK